MLSPKELKKLAAACRAAGIKSYKTPDFEFTLTDEAPAPKNIKSTANKTSNAEFIESDEYKAMDALTDEQLLFYSVASTDEEQKPMIGT